MTRIDRHWVGCALAVLLTLVAAHPLAAQNGAPSSNTGSAGSGVAAPMTEAEVVRVDREGAKITLRHGEIKALDMPAMTMVFQVKDKTLLDGLKHGDRVRFRAINEAGKLFVTAIESLPK